MCNQTWYSSIFTRNIGFLQNNVVLPLEGCVRTKSHIWAQDTWKFLNYLWKGWGKSLAKVVWLPFIGLTDCCFSLFSSRLIPHSRLKRTNNVPCFPENASDNLSCQLKLIFDFYTLLTFIMLRQMRTNSGWIFVKDPFVVLYLSISLPLCCSCCTSSWKWEARDHISF